MPLPARASSDPPSPVPGVVLARAITNHMASGAVRGGDLVRLTRGAYALPSELHDERGLALARAAGVQARLTSPHVLSHATAALLWDLPTWRTPTTTHVRQDGRRSARSDATVSRHVGLPPDERRAERYGLPVTDLAWTVADCLRTMSPLHGLVVLDAALRRGLATDELDALLAPLRGARGIARARAVLEIGDAGAESPGESAARWEVLWQGFPLPATQLPIRTRVGWFRGDLGWAEARVLLEYDGRVKYVDREVLVAEKRRHDAIVEAGWRVLRVTKEDLRDPAGLAARVRRLLPVPVQPRPLLAPTRPRS